MDLWIEKKSCTGCEVCSNICPKKAITMLEDKCGFAYPVIDNNLCINCGLCKRTCPVFSSTSSNRDNPKVYASWSNDEENRNISTSGGIFFEISKLFLETGGYIAGAKYNEENMVMHSLENNLEGVNKLRQSKYLQSNMDDIYIKIKEKLDMGYDVLFAGSPCQVAGIKKFLKKDYDKLLTVEFICRGMNSPKAYKSWLKEIETNRNKKVIKVWFKYKEYGWKQSPRCIRLDFNDGTYEIINGEQNLYMEGYLTDNLYIRPSCGACKFNGLPRQADITLADFWGIDKALDDDKGTSLILSNSEKGDIIVDKLRKKITIYNKELKDILEGNICFNNSVVINPKSEEFLISLDSNNFSRQFKKYHKKKLLIRRGLSKIKRIVKKRLNK